MRHNIIDGESRLSSFLVQRKCLVPKMKGRSKPSFYFLFFFFLLRIIRIRTRINSKWRNAGERGGQRLNVLYRECHNDADQRKIHETR